MQREDQLNIEFDRDLSFFFFTTLTFNFNVTSRGCTHTGIFNRGWWGRKCVSGCYGWKPSNTFWTNSKSTGSKKWNNFGWRKRTPNQFHLKLCGQGRTEVVEKGVGSQHGYFLSNDGTSELHLSNKITNYLKQVPHIFKQQIFREKAKSWTSATTKICSFVYKTTEKSIEVAAFPGTIGGLLLYSFQNHYIIDVLQCLCWGWPACSPDLSPIVKYLMKWEIRLQQPQTVCQSEFQVKLVHVKERKDWSPLLCCPINKWILSGQIQVFIVFFKQCTDRKWGL